MKSRIALAVVLAVSLLTVVPWPALAQDVPPCTQYSMRLSSTSPPRVLWPCPGLDPTWYGAIPTRDVTEDGIAEVAVGIRIPNNNRPWEGMVFLLNGATGRSIWYKRLELPILDLAFLPDKDSIIALSERYGSQLKSRVFALSIQFGARLWMQDIPGPHWPSEVSWDALSIVDDADADGIRDIAVGTARGVALLSGDGGVVLWQGFDSDVHYLKTIQDIDGDGMRDFIAGADGPCVYASSAATGAVIWFPTEGFPTNWVVCTIDVVDTTGLGNDNVVVGHTGWPGGVYLLDGPSGSVIWGHDMPGDDYHAIEIVGSPDLDGDGLNDLVVTSHMIGRFNDERTGACANKTAPCPGNVTAFAGFDGSIIWNYPSEFGPDQLLLLMEGMGPSFVVGDQVPYNFPSHVYRLDGFGREVWTYDPNDVPRRDFGFGKGRIPLTYPSIPWRDILELNLGPDIDRSGTPDILAVSANLRVYALSERGEVLWVFLP